MFLVFAALVFSRINPSRYHGRQLTYVPHRKWVSRISQDYIPIIIDEDENNEYYFDDISDENSQPNFEDYFDYSDLTDEEIILIQNGLLKKIGKGIKKAGKAVAKPVKKVVKGTGKAVKKVAKGTGKAVKSVAKTTGHVVKAGVKTTTAVVKTAGRVVTTAGKIAVKPGKAGKYIKQTGRGIRKDVKSAAKAYKPVINDVKREVKNAFRTVKKIAPYVGFVTCWVPIVGQIGLAASVASTLSTAYKAYQLYEAGVAVAKGIKHKDFASALGGIASAVGGSVGGSIGNAALKAAEYQRLYKQGELVYKGIKQGDFKKIAAGAASFVSKDNVRDIIGKSELLQQGLEYYQRGRDFYNKGRVVEKAIKTGHFGTAIEGLADLGLDIRGTPAYKKGEQLFNTGSDLYAKGNKIYSEAKEKLDIGKAALEAAKSGRVSDAVSLLKSAGVDATKSNAAQKALELYNKGETLYKQGDDIYRQGKQKLADGKAVIESLRLGKIGEAMNELASAGIDLRKYNTVSQAELIVRTADQRLKQLTGDAKNRAEVALAKLVLLGLNTTIYNDVDAAISQAKSAALTVVRKGSDGLTVYKDAMGRVGTLAELSEKKMVDIMDLMGARRFLRDVDQAAKVFSSKVGEEIAQKVTQGYLRLEDAQAKGNAQIEKIASEVQGKATKIISSVEELQQILAKAK